jgi:peptidoglycan/xylan/chitin deacetylase (PgdA/CDA1 family)
MIQYLGLAGLYVGGWYLFRRYKRNRTADRILAFHDINNRLDLSITRNTVSGFKNIIEYLASSGMRGTSLSEQKNINDIALTFDDGWFGFYDNAWPVLKDFGFSATVFLITDYVGKTSGWDYKKAQHLSWEQIQKLSEQGVEFGSHSATHVDLRRLDANRLDYELIGSKRVIEGNLGRPVKYFSYPFGRYNQRVIEAVKNAGYEKAYALSEGGGDLAISRTGVYLYDTPYSIYRKLLKQSWLEGCKDYINNSLAGGTIVLRRLFQAKTGDKI